MPACKLSKIFIAVLHIFSFAIFIFTTFRKILNFTKDVDNNKKSTKGVGRKISNKGVYPEVGNPHPICAEDKGAERMSNCSDIMLSFNCWTKKERNNVISLDKCC